MADQAPQSNSHVSRARPNYRGVGPIRYQTIAIIWLNISIVSLTVLAALDLLLPVEGFIWDQNLGGRRVSETFVPAHYYLWSPEETAATLEDWNRYVLNGHWRVHPWTGLISREFEGRFVSVDRNGRRGGRAPEKINGSSSFKVWIFGGSTVFGWGVSDSSTVASFLQLALHELIPDSEIEVVNFGVPWYNSSHEVALLLANLRESEAQPDRVIFLNGLNDLVHSIFYRNGSPLHPRLEQAWEEHLNGMFSAPPWIRFEQAFPLLRLSAKWRRQVGSPLGGVRLSSTETNEALIQQAANRYVRNHHAASALAKSFDVDATFCLQPVPNWLAMDRATTDDRDYRVFSEKVLEGCGPTLLDFRSALSGLGSEFAMSVEQDGVPLQ